MEMEYEICYLIGESKEANLEKIRKGIEKVVTKNKGTLIEGEFVRKRRLAYEIKKEARGTYVAKRFTLPDKDERDEKYPEADFIGEMTKDFNFNQDILRFIIVKADELPSLKELEEQVKKAGEERRGQRGNDGGGRKEVPVRKKTVALIKKKVQKETSVAVPIKKEKVEKKTQSLTSDGSGKVKKELPKDKIKKEKKAEKEKKELKDDISEDNIDEKLDEILNI